MAARLPRPANAIVLVLVLVPAGKIAERIDPNTNSLTVRSGQGNGTFQDGTPIPVGKSPTGLLVGDFNGDGRPDLAIADSGSKRHLVMRGLGDGTFQKPVRDPVGNLPRTLVEADFNHKLVQMGQAQTSNILPLGEGGTATVAVVYIVLVSIDLAKAYRPGSKGRSATRPGRISRPAFEPGEVVPAAHGAVPPAVLVVASSEEARACGQNLGELRKEGIKARVSRLIEHSSMYRHSITNEHWVRIAALLPGPAGDPGVTAKDNRLFVDAVLWIAQTGAPWRDLPNASGIGIRSGGGSIAGPPRASGSGSSRS